MHETCHENTIEVQPRSNVPDRHDEEQDEHNEDHLGHLRSPTGVLNTIFKRGGS